MAGYISKYCLICLPSIVLMTVVQLTTLPGEGLANVKPFTATNIIAKQGLLKTLYDRPNE